MLLKTIVDGKPEPNGDVPLDEARRQGCAPDVFISNGVIYLTRRDIVMEMGSSLGNAARSYQMPSEHVVDIDPKLDFQIPEALLISS
tara:strand:+ start:132 stop:392 length:261 start_codon:yes stop_codon:yes gene_type:complete